MGWRKIRQLEELEELKRKEQKGEIEIIEIRYMDESGFCLIPYVPYARHRINKKIEIKSQQSKRLNVLEFLSKFN